MTEPDLEHEGPGEHDAHLMDDDPSETVACAHCGKQVWAYAQRCDHCGVHFEGEAWEFHLPGVARHTMSPLWLCVVAAIVLIMLWRLLH